MDLIRQYKQIHSERTLSLSSFTSGKELINHVDEHGGFDPLYSGLYYAGNEWHRAWRCSENA